MTGAPGSARRPLIGVPGMWSAKVQGMRFAGAAVAVGVLAGIDRAGGEPVVLFPGSSESAADQLARLDGVVIPGGADIDPSRYGREPDEHYWPADYPGQDDYEAGLLQACLDSGIPTLAICRGMQLLNVVHGGTLVGHLVPGEIQHRGAEHPVTCEPGTLLASVLGHAPVRTSSYHHQAVDRVGAGLRVAARSQDGVVEALEGPNASLLAVQWHPEDLAEASATDHALFSWVVEAALARRARVSSREGTNTLEELSL
ncbi:gamma-glutamyl-gamma-aminobutyrate hydrolase family protein [Paeniglutamicibacter terrestris]|uniref:Gamma-glutamyl-gamma-aminobutyrate hydrolase family protein n=1 Tax=Paeniglutamicibacter terrestris TaxID=2723403 RepID=A0ABX1G814_9MICC|nr:gamma-glutamyl-gamma-aminobutyrate hydrolase family protein [Paeniglutamicibacter terrestris]ASN40388.1 peptidase C26 [Arthrobacter sp. 7749]NKG21716.1 gamma-glutamyl-gamma-aminobutyrate hydrolase family protein [Paeniglutamicibacter terrestris]